MPTVAKVSRQYGHPPTASAVVADMACLSVSLHGERKKKKIPFPQKETYSIKETAPGVKEFSFLLVNRLSDEDKTIAETPGQHFTYTEISAPWLSETQAFERECSCRWRESQLLTHRS